MGEKILGKLVISFPGRIPDKELLRKKKISEEK